MFFSNNKYGLLFLFKDNTKSYSCFRITARVVLIGLATLPLAPLPSFHTPARVTSLKPTEGGTPSLPISLPEKAKSSHFQWPPRF